MCPKTGAGKSSKNSTKAQPEILLGNFGDPTGNPKLVFLKSIRNAVKTNKNKAYVGVRFSVRGVWLRHSGTLGVGKCRQLPYRVLTCGMVLTCCPSFANSVPGSGGKPPTARCASNSPVGQTGRDDHGDLAVDC